MPQPLAIYIHWPFCLSKCPYCDFNSHVAASIDHDAWARAYLRELGHYADLLPERSVTSIFFGGGTPSLMQPQTVAAVLEKIAKLWRVADDVEITLEANPTSVEAEKFAALRGAGVNRLSLGIQSLRDEALKFLGRTHDKAAALRALEIAAQNFSRTSFDLIYARHGQTLEDWQAELAEALALGMRHLSLYQLTIEPNTQFHTLARRQPLTAETELAATMFEATNQIMADAGLPAYEISNYAAANQQSRHNLTYWRYEDYLGIGPGAHGRAIFPDSAQGRIEIGERRASENHRAPEVWLRQVEKIGHGRKEFEPITHQAAQQEALLMGLRLIEGISLPRWQEKFGLPFNRCFAPQRIQKLVSEGLLQQNSTTTKASAAGLQRLNGVLEYLVGD